MKGYIHIDARVFTELKLSGNEAILYALVYNYCKHGQKFERKLEDIAEQLNMSERGVRKTFDRLINAGLMTKVRKQTGVEYKTVRTEQSAEQERNKVPLGTEQSAEQERNKVPNTHFIINSNSKGVISDQTTPIEPPKSEYYGYIVEGMAAFYDRRFRRPYMPNWPTQTTNAKDLSAKVDKMLQAEGIELNDQNRREWWSGFLERGYAAGDQYHKDNFDLDVINKQFNNLLNRIQNGKSRQRPADQDAEYLAKLQDILSR